jgi:hypothetical protein
LKKAERLRFPRLNYTRPLIVPLIGASAFSVIVALFWKDLGLNLVADAAALWFGLFVVEVASEKGRADARKPAHRAMVDDLVRLRTPVTHVLSLLLWETATPSDIPSLRAALRGEGDVAKILARRRLTTSPALMRQLGILSGPQLTWWQVINKALSPQALRLEVLIARYVGVADATTLAALQGLEVCLFMDVLRGRILFDDDLILEVFWRSLIQSLAALDAELEAALMLHEDRGAVLGPASYIDFPLGQIEKGEKPQST